MIVDFPHKIIIPQRPSHLIARPRLTSILNNIAGRQLITISAPAGYGKTSLLIDFANGPAPLPICWYSIEQYDRDVWVFLGYLVAAVERRFPGAIQQTRHLLTDNDPVPLATAFAAFARDLYAIGEHFILIIDDWHLVDHVTEIADIISQLLVRCPFLHLILASRSYPGLSNVMLLAARRQMISLDEKPLCFTAEEAASVLSAEAETPVSLEHATKLVTQAQGWITGIMLLQAPEPTTYTPSFSTTRAERQVYRFLAEQVFDQQPADVRSFLLESSLLDDLTYEHCDKILQRIDSRRLLDALLRRHLFVSEIKPGVLRYQPLFREFLQEQFSILNPERYRAVIRQVADMYVAQGQWSLAFEHYLEVGDRAAAEQVIASSGESLYTKGRLETLEHWFDALGSDNTGVKLLCLQARVLLDRGQYEKAQTLANLAETRINADDNADQTMVLLLQAQIGRITGQYQRALELGQHALAITNDPSQQAAALRTIGICHHRLEQTDRAIDELQQALALYQKYGNLYMVAHIQRDLGICYTAIGQLQKADDYYRQAEAYWATTSNAGLRAMSLNSLGGTQRLMGRFQEVHTTLSRALQYAREGATPSYQAVVLSNLGDLYADLQLWDAAKQAYDDALKIGGSAHLMDCLELSAIGLLIKQQQYEAATCRLHELSPALRKSHLHDIRLLECQIACGLHNYTRAEHDVGEAIDVLSGSNSPMILARAYLIQAQIFTHTRPSDSVALLSSLNQAVQLTQQLGHDTFLVTEMLHMRDVQRRAALAGWKHAQAWQLRQQEILRVARVFEDKDERPVITVRALGVDQIMLNNQEVDLGWQKAREVFYYLLAYPDGARIDTLREAIWPQLSLERSREALRSAIYQLRSVLPRELITLQGRQIYRIDSAKVHISYDYQQLLQILSKRPLDREAMLDALELYQGPFLAHIENDWCISLRSYLEQRYLEALRLLASAFEKEQAFSEALALYQKILALDTLDEAMYAGAMRCLIALGNRSAAINQYQILRRHLDEEMGIEPSSDSEVEQLYLYTLKL